MVMAEETAREKEKRNNHNKINIKWKITIQEEQTSTKLNTQP